jgi:hypothetical protein
MGLWEPTRFLKEHGVGIYMLEVYDPDKTPVLFINGAGGSAQNWRYFLRRLDRTRFQAWFFLYHLLMRSRLGFDRKRVTPIVELVTSAIITSNWRKHVEKANEYNKPGKFTTLIGTGGQVSKVDHSYVRQALTNGVGLHEYLGANPFKYSIVAGGDSHPAFSDNEKFNYTGVHGVNDDTPKWRLSGAGQTAGEAAIVFSTPGATGVWAPKNTREAVFGLTSSARN